MPRPHRDNQEGVIHHVVTRGNNKQDIFRERSDYFIFAEILRESCFLHPLAIYNYALMTNHIHLLVETKKKGSFSKAIGETMRKYAIYFNQKYNHVGHVFQSRFKSSVIDRNGYFFLCSRYIDLNPVEAGIINSPQDYPWSGYATLAFGKAGIIPLEFHSLYEGLGNTPEERRLSYRNIVGPPLVPSQQSKVAQRFQEPKSSACA
ncbi:MAG: transposase [Candidatus Omnitrophica bacterium]|nr:transposase [Candidatus Omnitrophota bacterium]